MGVWGAGWVVHGDPQVLGRQEDPKLVATV